MLLLNKIPQNTVKSVSYWICSFLQSVVSLLKKKNNVKDKNQKILTDDKPDVVCVAIEKPFLKNFGSIWHVHNN